MTYNGNYGGNQNNPYLQQNRPYQAQGPNMAANPTESFEYKKAKKKLLRKNIILGVCITGMIVGFVITMVAPYEADSALIAGGLLMGLGFWVCLCGICGRKRPKR